MRPHSIDLSNERAWRPFAALGRREAAFLTKLYGGNKPSRHEFSCIPGTTNFCAIRQAAEKAWDWTVFDAAGEVLDHGVEPTRAAVLHAAAEAQPLWFHRCAAKGECRCHGSASGDF